jgi:ribosome-associated protein
MNPRELEELVRRLAGFHFSRAGGPGGQNVNKVSSRVTAACPGACRPGGEGPAWPLAWAAGNAEGLLQLSVRDTRDQARNREIAVRRLAALLAAAMREPHRRRATHPSAGSRERRLSAKKRRSQDKRLRAQKPEPD